jgi:hypothetical protein
MTSAVKKIAKFSPGAHLLGLDKKKGGDKPAAAVAATAAAPGPERSAAKGELLSFRRSQVAAEAGENGAVRSGNDADLLGDVGKIAPGRKSASAKYLGG